jgi:hypothetical protein
MATISPFDVSIADFQETANYLNLEYSAETLWRLYQYQYRTFKPRCPNGSRETDYVVEQMNGLLETMRSHYGPTGGGRYTLPRVRAEEMRGIELRLVK